MVPVSSYILKPCRADKSYTLKIKGVNLRGEEIVRALITSLLCKLIAQTKMLSVLELEGMLISVHSKGDILLRQVQTQEHADAIASKIVAIIGSTSRG